MSKKLKACGYCVACQDGIPEDCYDPVMAGTTVSNDTAYSYVESSADFFSNKALRDLPPIDTGKEYYALEKCAKSHPALKIRDGVVIYGGAASYPVADDFDVYVSLDKFSSAPSGKQPWDSGWKPAVHVSYPITDMSTPSDPAAFKKMVAWVAVQLEEGKKVHVGCLGGHGRTGTVLAALVKHMTGNDDAIKFVRDNYCKKAVETDSQAKWLAKHFGVKFQPGTKGGWHESGSKNDRLASQWDAVKNSVVGHKKFKPLKYMDSGDPVVSVIDPVCKKGNVWGLK